MSLFLEILIPLLFTSLFTIHFHFMKQRRIKQEHFFEKIERSLTLLDIQHRAMVYAIQRTTGNGFSDHYDEKLQELIQAEKFKDSK